MIQNKITYEQVKEAADLMLAAGKRPTLSELKNLFGNVSHVFKLYNYLDAWRKTQPPVDIFAELKVLPKEIEDLFNGEIIRIVNIVTSGVKQELAATALELKAERDRHDATRLALAQAENEFVFRA